MPDGGVDLHHEHPRPPKREPYPPALLLLASTRPKSKTASTFRTSKANLFLTAAGAYGVTVGTVRRVQRAELQVSPM